MDINVLLDKLHVVTQNGRYYRCFCPTHADTKPSLSVWIEDDGRVRMKCFAGCRSTQILESVGLKWSDLNGDNQSKRRFVCAYNYTDENANLLYQVVRFDPKSFAQRRPDGAGGWIWNLNGVRRVLYRLHSLVKAPPSEPVWFVEGEKDADRLAKEGLLSTCICGGSSATWLNSYSSQLTVAGKRELIYVIADADKPGRAFARNVAYRMAADSVAKKIIIVDLYPDKENKYDVSDYLDEGHTVSELIEIATSGVTGSVISVSLAPRSTIVEFSSTEQVSSTISDDDVPF